MNQDAPFNAVLNGRRIGGYQTAEEAIRVLKYRLLNRHSRAKLAVYDVSGSHCRRVWEMQFRRSGKMVVTFDERELEAQAKARLVVTIRERPSGLSERLILVA